MPRRSAQADASIQDDLRRYKAGVFQALGHPTRIHIVECLRDGEKPVGAILKAVAVEAANLSQHLSVLRSRQLVQTRKEGNVVYYRLRDRVLVEVLEIMRTHFLSHLEESLAMLREVEGER